MALFTRKTAYAALERKLGYRFKKRALLETALTHRSYRYENDDTETDNQRMEFLGDAVLGFITAAHLFKQLKYRNEGVLTSCRSQATSGKALAELAEKIDLGRYIKIGKGEEQSGGRQRASNLADAMEAVICAAYLDGGMKGAQKILTKLFVPLLNQLDHDMWAGNPKGELQEYTQREWKNSPRYRIVKKEGPPHATIFSVEVKAGHIKANGHGNNKQEAEVQAAVKALKKLNSQ